MTIEEGNKLIAEFMDAKKMYFKIYRDGNPSKYYGEKISATPFKDVPFNDNIHESGRNMTKHPLLQHHAWQMTPENTTPVYDSWLKYHSSWDWLMPVVEKIEALGYEVVITSGMCHIFNTKDLNNEFCNKSNNNKTSKIELVITTILEFIQWYNQNKESL